MIGVDRLIVGVVGTVAVVGVVRSAYAAGHAAGRLDATIDLTVAQITRTLDACRQPPIRH